MKQEMVTATLCLGVFRSLSGLLLGDYRADRYNGARDVHPWLVTFGFIIPPSA